MVPPSPSFFTLIIFFVTNLLLMSNAFIIVDDQDSQLNYTGQWSVAGAGVDYGQTLHASNVSTSSVSFAFSGMSP